jgi:hypothetical protein
MFAACDRFHGVGITGWYSLSLRSPRCIASCSTHQRHNLFPKLNAPRSRPQLLHFAISDSGFLLEETR